MVSKETYYNDAFWWFLKISMLMVNVYFFFIKMAALPKCLSNLFQTFDRQYDLLAKRTLSLKTQRQIIEFLCICYLAGA